MIHWVYIAGRGYSDSTTLDAMLGNAEEVESVGELVSGMARYDERCSCGERFRDCPFWVSVRNRFEQLADFMGRSGPGVEPTGSYHDVPATLLSSPSSGRMEKLVRICEYIGAAIQHCSEGEPKVLVDSSKEITRALFLSRFVRGTKVIHLVKHPESILQSYYSRLNERRKFKFLRMRFTPRRYLAPFLLLATVSWMAGNIMTEIIRCFSRKRFLRVRYEDLVKSPVDELERLESFIGVSLEEVKSKVSGQQAFSVGHNIGGNQMRMAKEFKLDSAKANRVGLPKRYTWMVKLICAPLLWFYGYCPSQRNPQN
ncbi:MAG: sulfotransferase [Lentisphaeria bacterium]